MACYDDRNKGLCLHGEFLVLVGPSGCGKSTLLRMIAGLEEVSAGEIFIGDRRVTDVPSKDRDVAMVFQNYALYPHMTVRQNLSFGLRARRVERTVRREKVESVAKVLGLSELLDRRPASLSGGQRQRVAMGRAMVREPSAYLMDEPLSNLDAQLRVEMRAELARVHQRLGTTTVYVTHDQIEAMTLGQRVAVLRDGVLQQCDTPSRLYREPVNVFVATFIGSPAMNVLRCTTTAEGIVVGEQSVGLRGPRGAGDEVLLGFRPTAIRLATSSPGALDATVELVENLGDVKHVVATIPGAEPVTLVVDERVEVQRGQRVAIELDPGSVHFFDPGTGAAIRRAHEPAGA